MAVGKIVTIHIRGFVRKVIVASIVCNFRTR